MLCGRRHEVNAVVWQVCRGGSARGNRSTQSCQSCMRRRYVLAGLHALQRSSLFFPKVKLSLVNFHLV